MITSLGKHTSVPNLIYTERREKEKGRSRGGDLEGADKRRKSSVRSVSWK